MGRPDMAYFGFADKYFAGEPIKIFNNGDFEKDLYRDFTYIDDSIEGIERLLSSPPAGEVRHTVFNIGNNSPEKLMAFIETLERALSRTLGRRYNSKRFMNLLSRVTCLLLMLRQINCKKRWALNQKLLLKKGCSSLQIGMWSIIRRNK